MFLKGKVLCLIVMFLSSHFKAQISFFQSLQAELKQTNLKVEYTEQKTREIKIRKPIVNSRLFSAKIEKSIKKHRKAKYCKKGGVIEVNYESTWLTNNLLSVKEDLSIMFCKDFPSDIIDVEFHNYLIRGGSIFEIELVESREVIVKIKDKLKSAELDPDCAYIYEDLTLSLFFKDGKPYVNAKKDKVCEFQVEIDIIESNFKYKPI